MLRIFNSQNATLSYYYNYSDPTINSSDVTFPGMDSSYPFPQQGQPAQLAVSLLLRIATTPHIYLGE